MAVSGGYPIDLTLCGWILVDGAEYLETADDTATILTGFHGRCLRDHRPPITVLLQFEGRPVLEIEARVLPALVWSVDRRSTDECSITGRL